MPLVKRWRLGAEALPAEARTRTHAPTRAHGHGQVSAVTRLMDRVPLPDGTLVAFGLLSCWIGDHWSYSPHNPHSIL